MPCTYIETPDEIRKRKNAEKRQAIAPYRVELNNVTRLLCEVLTELEKPYIPEKKLKEFKATIFSNPKLKAWWIDHQIRDNLRKGKQVA
jgi:hypothetical protein